MVSPCNRRIAPAGCKTDGSGSRFPGPAKKGEQYPGDAGILRDGPAISAREYKTILDARNHYDIEDVIGFDALYESMQRCKRGVLWKSSAASYCLNALERTIRLEEELKGGTYKPRPPKHFKVMHPKERDIISIPFRDRVYQRSLNDNVIYPEITKSFIPDNFACQKGKGTDAARERLKRFLQKAYRRWGTSFYVLQVDIKGYYPTMRHDVAKGLFKSKLPEEVHIRAARVLDGQYAGEVGFSPGSQMVQICGISVLDRLDHHIKERLRVKYYLRYMDDLILIHEDPAFLQKCLARIRAELEKIGFEVSEKKTSVYPVSKGILFLGFRFRLSDTGKVYLLIDPKNVKSERKKLARLAGKAKAGEFTRAKVDGCYQAWKAHASKGSTFKLLQRMDAYYKSLWEGMT